MRRLATLVLAAFLVATPAAAGEVEVVATGHGHGHANAHATVNDPGVLSARIAANAGRPVTGRGVIACRSEDGSKAHKGFGFAGEAPVRLRFPEILQKPGQCYIALEAKAKGPITIRLRNRQR
jgi:hypothetical protein